MHECGHGSLFKNSTYNKGFGFLFGVLVGMPQYVWSNTMPIIMQPMGIGANTAAHYRHSQPSSFPNNLPDTKACTDMCVLSYAHLSAALFI
jgi:hypothetical protein